MPKRMLRQVMSVNDIYAYAEPIMAMLREEYGSYDADALDEVLVEDPFVHRLQARGYEVLVSTDFVEEAPAAAPRATRRRSTTASSAPAKAPEAEAKPASRTRRTTAASAPAADSVAGDSTESAPTPRRTTRRTTRTTRASSDGEGSES